MKKLPSLCSVILLTAGIGFTGMAWADDEGARPNLGGMKFAIEGEYLFDLLGIGAPFTNCYTFGEDMAPGDTLISGVWDDPAFPVPGMWFQHTDWGKIEYTAIADTGAGLSLVQNGTVKGEGAGRLKAYTIVSLAPFGVIAEILSEGQAVDECP